jgi:ankyrin repeat protein
MANCSNSQAGSTPLHSAAQDGRIDIARALLSAGADKELKNKARPATGRSGAKCYAGGVRSRHSPISGFL